MIGRCVSHYRITELIGEGGMGVVYKALDTRLDRTVAIKVVRPGVEDRDAANERFLREARAVSRVDHPNVVTVLDVLFEEGTFFLVMQYVDGKPLREHITGRCLALSDALRIAVEIGRGLEAVHEIGVVHRDVKPENVMLTSHGACKLLDFGVAHLANRSTLRGTGALVGTVAYMAPEQVLDQAVDARTDVYGLGVVLYEMLTGRLPFEPRDKAALLHAIATREPPDPDDLRPDLPRRLARVVLQALSKHPSERYQGMGDFLHDLELVRDQLASTVPITGRRLRARPRFLRRWRHSLGVMVLATAVVVAGVWAVRTMEGNRGVPRVLVMPWVVRSPDRELQWLSTAIMDCLIRTLGAQSGFNVVSRETATATVEAMSVRSAGLMGGELDAATKLGARYLVTGTVEPSADRLRIGCQVSDARSGIVLGSWTREIADVRSQLFPALDELAGAIGEELGRRTGRHVQPGPPVAQALTPSIPALKEYQVALTHAEIMDTPAALEHLNLALSHDSTFTDAHLIYARLTPDVLVHDRELALAMKYRFRAPVKTRLLVEAEDLADRQAWDAARAKYAELLKSYPEDVISRSAMAELEMAQRQFDEAAGEYSVLHDFNPYDYSYYPQWANAYFEIGRADRARAVLWDWHTAFPGLVAPLAALIHHDYTVGSYAEGLTFCDTLDRLHPGSGGPLRPFLLLELGRPHAAKQALDPNPGPTGLALPIARRESYLSWIAYCEGDFASGLAFARRALHSQPDSYNYWLAGLSAAGSGDIPLARQYAESIAAMFGASANDTADAEAYGDRRAYFHLLGEIEMRASSGPVRAVESLARAVRYSSRTDQAYFRTAYGSALLRAGDAASARGEFERVLRDNPNYPDAILGLGRACLAARAPLEAREPLARLRELWRSAEPDEPRAPELKRLLAAAGL